MEILKKLLDKKPENKAALYLIYYPAVALSMVVAWFLIAYILPEAAAWAFGIAILLMPIAGILYLIGFIIKKLLLRFI